VHQVSVIIPNYNHAKYLDERIQSVIQQTYSISEIIILDDFSTDESLAIIDKYNKDPRIKIVPNETNSGSTFKQWDKGIKLANNEFIWIAESDDFSSQKFLENTISSFDDKNVVLSYCNSFIVDDTSLINGIISATYFKDLANIFHTSFQMNGVEFLTKYLLHNNVIPNTSSVVFKKSIYENASVCCTNLSRTGDWLAWMQIATQGDIYYNASCFNYFRVHSKSVTAQNEMHSYKYGLETRMEFSRFLLNNYSLKFIDLNHKNNYYISLDRGERGLRYLRDLKIIDALTDIFYASFVPNFKSYYIKKAISICFRYY
jgi:glycosyltransferase involved in cell wall biosynthesis